MKISIIVPAHNEEKTIGQVLRGVLELDLGEWEREVIVVDDGSSDGTGEILKDSRFQDLKIISHPKNLGKGAAIKSAIAKATGDYVIIQDADLEYFPQDIPKLLSAAKNRQIVFGDRGVKRYPERGFHYVIGAKILTWTVNLLFGSRLHDLYTGYKLIPLQVIRSFNLESAGFEFEAEVTCKILKAGYKIAEIPINYQPRNKEQGKHIRAKDAVLGLWTIVKFRLQ